MQIWYCSGLLDNGHEVRGSMTLEELAQGFDMNVDTLLTVLGIPPDIPDSTKIFDLEEINEKGI